ncbi:ribonuclease YeeF family protein [Cytobacillus purgationiresistens]|uniref:Archaellum component FlaC n=1 Tax=Cytobacillus purgationiresistens TaxID=863449 RepID=A0ABU0AQ47_9BACI|nr:LXG domain-containing protein [Cytobacillus purgationiresistens]MDQ0273323.1 archaellum component FlaC [Cytobacillus purgationiresistens]
MKTLEVESLHSGIEEILEKLNSQKEQVKQIEASVEGIITLNDSLKGQGGQSIRSFYQDCHQPFLLFYQDVMNEYVSSLKNVKSTLHSFEPSHNGFISQSFLQGDLCSGLNKTKEITADLTNEANMTIASVQDIVSLPKLRDNDVINQVNEAKKNVDQTVEKLHHFDNQQSQSLNNVEQDIQIMNTYVQQIQTMFNNGSLSVATYSPNSLYSIPPDQEMGAANPFSSFASHPRVTSNGVEATDTNGLNMQWDPTPTLGVNFDQWKDQPINAGANLGIAVTTAYGAAKRVNLARKGFGITKTYRTTAQGVRKPVVKIDKPELGGFKKKTYSGTNVTNHPKLNKLIDPMASVKDSFKWASNKLGYLGVGVTVTGDIVHGVQNNQSGSEIAGNVVGDVAIAGASIAASAAAGAKVGAIAGTFGGPVGVAVGATVGAIVGIGVTTLLSDVKFMDVDGDGKSDSVGDAIKKGTKGIIDKVGSWFK